MVFGLLFLIFFALLADFALISLKNGGFKKFEKIRNPDSGFYTGIQTSLVISSASSESIILEVPINEPIYPPPAAG